MQKQYSYFKARIKRPISISSVYMKPDWFELHEVCLLYSLFTIYIFILMPFIQGPSQLGTKSIKNLLVGLMMFELKSSCNLSAYTFNCTFSVCFLVSFLKYLISLNSWIFKLNAIKYTMHVVPVFNCIQW